MSEGNIRNYQVNYTVNASGTAQGFFKTLAEQTKNMETPLADLEAKIKTANSHLSEIQNKLNLKPTLDLTLLTEALAEAEKLVELSANRMAESLGKVMGKGATPPANQTKKSVKQTAANAEKDTQKAKQHLQSVQKPVTATLPAVSRTVTKAASEREKVLDLKTKLNGGKIGAQLTAALAEAQKIADTKPVVLKAMFTLDKAGFQLHQAISSLQKLADSKPIVLRATVSSPNIPNDGVPVNAPQTATIKSGDGSTQINATPITSGSNETVGGIAKQTISDNGTSSASVHNARELAKLHEKIALQAPHATNESKPAITRTPAGANSPSTRAVRPQGDLYTRSRTFWYPLTGNTSFGARTPMAVDMVNGMGAMFAIGGAMSAVGSSLSQSIEYQNIMKTTNAILENGTDNYSIGSFKDMERIVRQVGKDTKFTAPQVADAARFLAMAGYDIPAINAAIKPVSDIALIGDTDLGTTADKLTNVMTTFSIAPEKMSNIADIMATTFTRSNTDMMMLAESAKYAGGIAHLYGGNFQNNFADVMAMFGVLGNAGIQASTAGTTLRMMYQNLMQPNKKQKEALKSYGIQTRDSNGNPLEMANILKQIAEKVPENKLADAIGNMFRITAQPGAAALATHLGGPNGLVALMNANRASAGSGVAGNIANEKKNTMAGLLAQVESAFTEGVLQAFESREGGWADMLKQLRDYLAEPETVEILKSIIDLVERLAKIMGKFAKFYANIYNMFPDVINFWMKFQLIATQFGYLATPIVQLIGVLNMLKTAIMGTATAATAGAIAENSVKKARKANLAASAAGGFASRYADYVQSGKAAAKYMTYQSSKAYWANKWADMVNIADSRREKVVSMYGKIPDNKWWSIAFTNPQLASDIKANPRSLMLRGVAPTEEIRNEFKVASRASKHAQFAKGKISAAKSEYLENLRAVRRPEQMMNRALIDRYAAIGGSAALIASARARIAARDARIASIAAARHASRGMVASKVRERFAKMNGFKKAAGMSWKTSFSAGQALGTLSMASMVGSLKNMALSLFSGLAKAIGMLTSPVGLVTLAIGTAVTATIAQINRIKKAQAQSEKQAKSDAQTMAKNQKAAYKPIEDLNKKYRTIGDTLRPAEDTQAVESVKQSKKWYNTYIGAFNTNSDAKDAEKAWYKSILGNNNTRLAFGNRKLRYADSWNATGKKTFEGSINYGGDNISAKQLYHQQRDARNYNSADSRAREALFLAGASNDTTVKAQQEIIKLRQQLLAGKITSDAYTKQANKIRASVANPKMPELLNAMDYSASELKNAPDITRFSQYQQGAWNLLTAELNADIGTFSGYLNGVEQLKKGAKAYSDQWWYAVACVYDGMKYPLEKAGKTTEIVLNALPNGHIDTSRIITQIQQIAENLQFNISDFAKMASSIYEAMAEIDVVPGKYYSDFMKFTYSQTQHADVTAADAGTYFDRYIAKGDKNATWGGLNRQQYIDYVQSSSGNKGRAAKERVLIRKTLSYNAAINAKRQYDKTVKSVHDLTGNNKDKGGTSGSNAGTDKNKGGNQKEYANTYDRSAARPTQVIINIDNLARFDRTAIAGNSDERAITEAIETKIAEAVAMLSAQALNSASSLIAQNV